MSITNFYMDAIDYFCSWSGSMGGRGGGRRRTKEHNDLLELLYERYFVWKEWSSLVKKSFLSMKWRSSEKRINVDLADTLSGIVYSKISQINFEIQYQSDSLVCKTNSEMSWSPQLIMNCFKWNLKLPKLRKTNCISLSLYFTWWGIFSQIRFPR